MPYIGFPSEEAIELRLRVYAGSISFCTDQRIDFRLGVFIQPKDIDLAVGVRSRYKRTWYICEISPRPVVCGGLAAQ